MLAKTHRHPAIKQFTIFTTAIAVSAAYAGLIYSVLFA